MGTIRSEIARLIEEDAAKLKAANKKRVSDEDLQSMMIEELLRDLFSDIDVLDRLKIRVFDPLSGAEIRKVRSGLGSVTLLSSELPHPFVNITVGFCADTNKYIVVEWSDEFHSKDGNNPYEHQRSYFDASVACLNWISALMHNRLECEAKGLGRSENSNLTGKKVNA